MKTNRNKLFIFSFVGFIVIILLVVGLNSIFNKPVEKYGMHMLSIKEVEGLKTVVDENGDPLQLRGVSTHGLQWFSAVVNHNAFAAFKNDWNANVVRLAMYINEDGYNKRPDQMKQKVINGIDHAIANDLYVIVDWHVHYPGNPNHESYAGAMDFFKDISSLYPNSPNIIYEIANEPNHEGENPEDGVTNDIEGWRQVKAYAEPIIEMLRESGNENLVIVGNPDWSKRPDLAADEPIDDENTAYTFHFYTGTHNDGTLMNAVQYALDNGVAVFATEWGTSESSGTNGPFLEEADEWLDFLDENHIGWVNWSVTNKQEVSAAFIPNTILNPGDDQVFEEETLTDSGMYIRDRLRSYE